MKLSIFVLLLGSAAAVQVTPVQKVIQLVSSRRPLWVGPPSLSFRLFVLLSF